MIEKIAVIIMIWFFASAIKDFIETFFEWITQQNPGLILICST